MAKQNEVHKIYKLSTLGYADISKQLEKIAEKFEIIKKAKLSAQGKLSLSGDIANVMKYGDEVAQLTKEEALLRVEHQRLANDLKATQLQRQVDINQQRQRINLNNAEAGSIALIRKDIRELNAALILKNQQGNSLVDFKGEVLTIDQATKKMKELTAAEQAFRRQFQKDGTLVGEYTSGIIKSFKDMGLDDLIKGQISRSGDELEKLNADFDRLQKELLEVKATGKGSLDTIEKELIDNRREALGLRTELNRLQTEFRGIGDIGGQISNSLTNGLRDARGQLSSLVLGYVGFQATLQGIQKAATLNFSFEDTANSLQAITGVAGRDLEFLKEQAEATSNATRFSAVEILESFKLIASAKPELLENVTALNQIKDAAVLLAQASGQSLPEAVGNLTAVLNQFGAGAEQAGGFIDALAAGAKFGAAEIPQITQSLLDFGTQAKSSNISVQESIALIELLAEKGIQGAEAGTKLRNVLLALNAAGALDKKAQDSLKAQGVSIKILSDNTLPLEARLKELSKIQGDNIALLNVFGKENFNAGQIVLQSVPRYAELAEQIQATGIAQEQATVQTEGASTAWAKLRNQIANAVTSEKVTAALAGLATALSFIISYGGILIPILSALVVSFIAYRVQLTIAAFQQGLLNANTLSFYILNNLRVAQQAVLNSLQAAQNLLTSIYIGLQIRAALATGASAVAIRALSVAFRFLTGPIGIAIGLTLGLVTAFGVLSGNAKSTMSAVNSLGKSQAQLAAQGRINAEISERVTAATSEQVAKIKTLTKLTTDQTVSDKTRFKALNELIKLSPEYRSALQGEAIDIAKVIEVSDKLIDSLRRQAKARAVGDLAAEKEKRVFEIESQVTALGRTSVTDETGGGAFLKNLASGLGLGKGTKGQQLRDLSNELTEAKGDLEAIYEQVKGNQEIQNAITTTANTPPSVVPDADTKTKSRASRLTGIQKDAFKDIEARRDEQLALDETAFKKLEITEEIHLQNVLKINQSALDQKLKVLSGSNAEERKQIAEMRLERLTIEQDTNQKIFAIRHEALKIQLDDQIRALKESDRLVQEDPTKSASDKAQAKLDSDKAILELQLKFNQDVDGLERQLNQRSLANAKEGADAVRDQRRKIFEDERALGDAALADIADAGDKERLQYSINYTKLRKAIIDNDKLTAEQRKEGLEKLARMERFTILSSELAQLTLEFKQIAAEYDKGLVTEAEYLRKKAELEKKAEDQTTAKKDLAVERIDLPSERGTQELLRGSLSQAFGFDEDSAEDQLLGEAISQSFDLATDAMNSYFDAERDRIQKSLDIQLQRLDLEKEQVKNRAQSQAEIDSIDKQYEAKKRTAEREAGERLKKSRRAEAKVALASELANIAVSAAANPANSFTFGAAGIAMYAALAGIAIGRYALRVGEINREKFEFGGQPGKKKKPVQRIVERVSNFFAYGGAVEPKKRKPTMQKGIRDFFAIGGLIDEVTRKKKTFSEVVNESRRNISEVNESKKSFATGGKVEETVIKKTFSEIINESRKRSKELKESRESITRKDSFAFGGDVPTKTGGEIKGKSHAQGGAPFVFKGRRYEAEADELAIIRTRNAPRTKRFTVTGTQMEIASAINRIGGGVNFKPGALVRSKFAAGGYIGEKLQPPEFTPAGSTTTIINNNGLDNDGVLDTIKQQAIAIQKVSDQVLSLEVYQKTSTVSSALKKQVLQNSIGKL